MFFLKVTKNEFERRAKRFHQLSYKYLIEVYLKENHVEIYNKLHVLKNGSSRLPFVDLSEEEEEIKVFNKLDRSIKKSHNDEELIKWQQQVLRKKLYDKPTFTINSIAGTQVTVGIGSYYSTISTSDIHYFRLVVILGKENFTSIEDLSKEEKYHINSWIDLLNIVLFENRFTDYHASIGMSVFTVMKGADKKYRYIIKSNSNKKSSSALEKHVLPSFMFQPLTTTKEDQEKELSEVINIQRETGEELLNMEELEHSPQEVTFDKLKSFFKESRTLTDTFDLVAQEECPLKQTGFMFDIFRMRPEFTYCLILKKAFTEEKVIKNWETEKLSYIDLDCDSSYNNLIEDQIEPLCAPGLAAVIHGRNYALDVLEYDFT